MKSCPYCHHGIKGFKRHEDAPKEHDADSKEQSDLLNNAKVFIREKKKTLLVILLAIVLLLGVVLFGGLVYWLSTEFLNSSEGDKIELFTTDEDTEEVSLSSLDRDNDVAVAEVIDVETTRSLRLVGDADGFPIKLRLEIDGDEARGKYINVNYGTRMSLRGRYINQVWHLTGEADGGIEYEFNLEEYPDGNFLGTFGAGGEVMSVRLSPED